MIPLPSLTALAALSAVQPVMIDPTPVHPEAAQIDSIEAENAAALATAEERLTAPPAIILPLPDALRTLIEAAMAKGEDAEVATVVTLARETHPQSLPEIDALFAAYEAQKGDAEPKKVPNPVRDMLEVAIESGQDRDVEAVGKLAKQANPEDAALFDTMLADYRAKRAKEKAAKEAAERERIEQAKLWENWKGEGQIGASHATGNTKSAGLSLGIGITRKGNDWDQRFRAQADYQRTNGRTTVDRYLAEYEPQIRISPRAFAFGLGRWEDDRMQGFDTRWSASGGLGYKLIQEDDVTLNVKAGPAWRQTHYIKGGRDTELTGLGGLDFAWQMSPTLRLTQTASTIIGERTTTTSALTSVNAKLTKDLSARFSYAADLDTNPPAGIEKLDTRTRFTLVYGF